jgi:ferredoxin-NADP reductase
VRGPLSSWDPAVDDTFVCTALRPVAPGVLTVVLAPRTPSTIAFDAGQYVVVEFDVDGEPVQRTYTLASPPTRPERIAITVKRAAEGRVSRWLHDGGFRLGTQVRVSSPDGSFTRSAHPAPAYLLLTAGTGITPALSMLRELYDLGGASDLVLVHAQARAGDTPYAEELAWIARQLPGLRLHLICREASPGPFSPETVVSGRLDAGLLGRLVPDLHAREVLICGPPSYRAAAREAAVASGAVLSRVHEESFLLEPTDAVALADPTLAAEPAGPAAADQAEGAGTFSVVFRGQGVTVTCGAGTTLLDAAASAGLRLPHSCAQGICGTCKSTLVSGEVDMRHAGGIRPREIAAGKVLLCCSIPLTDVEVAS